MFQFTDGFTHDVLAIFCGRDERPRYVEGRSNSMNIIFRTNGYGTGRGWMANYTSRWFSKVKLLEKC